MHSLAAAPASGTKRLAAAMLAFALAITFQVSAANLATSTSPTDLRVPAYVDPQIFEKAGRQVGIIVQKWNPFDRSAERGIERLGGTVTRELPIVDGFSAVVPSSSADDLSELPGARAVTLNGPVQMQGASTDASKLKSVYPKAVRATKMWSSGYTGAGVTVALIDTGVADVADISGRVLPVYDDVTGQWSPCVNLTGESHCGDSYGHGTFMAGIIAGNGASSGGKWKGVAPDANLVSIKIAGYDGSADVSTLLAAIQWTVSFKDRYNIRILNLSLGTNGRGSYKSDPLNYAVQRAWASGVAVVVSASNRGPDNYTISKPGDDPWVITVGAIDDMGTVGYGDDQIPNFSSRGPTASDGLMKPDLVAPGGHIVSLRAPGSAIDTQFPNYIDDHYRKGSGTSMSAAVVSGSIATMLEAKPGMSPNRVKFALMSTAKNAASNDLTAVGMGIPDVYAATFEAPLGEANALLERSSGLGDLDTSRGEVRVQASDPELTIVNGLLTLQLLLFDPLTYTGTGWDATSWYASSWYATSWYASSWYASSWYSNNFSASSWYGEINASSWYGNEWYASSWYGAWE